MKSRHHCSWQFTAGLPAKYPLNLSLIYRLEAVSCSSSLPSLFSLSLSLSLSFPQNPSLTCCPFALCTRNMTHGNACRTWDSELTADYTTISGANRVGESAGERTVLTSGTWDYARLCVRERRWKRVLLRVYTLPVHTHLYIHPHTHICRTTAKQSCRITSGFLEFGSWATSFWKVSLNCTHIFLDISRSRWLVASYGTLVRWCVYSPLLSEERELLVIFVVRSEHSLRDLVKFEMCEFKHGVYSIYRFMYYDIVYTYI